jgi:deoxycytidylate deaminase
MLINAGIKRVLYAAGYDDPLADRMLAEAGIEMTRFVP